jgi:acetyl esterase/lipase
MKKLFLAIALFVFMKSISQTVVPLYEGKIPHNIPCDKKEFIPAAGRVQGITVPTLTVFLPEKKDSFNTAVIICPGGGYTRLAIDHEGYEVAKEFNKHGVAAFVLKYRIPNDSCMENKEVVPLQDAERAIQMVREHAKEWNINIDKVGIMGFSAGGHLASTLATHFNQVDVDNPAKTNLRADFAILGYPVVSLTDSLAHKGSRENLLGKNPSQEKIIQYSNELQVTPQTSPTFIVHAADDKTVNIQNSIALYQALLKNKVAAEIHIYQKGGHGFGLHNATTKDFWFTSAINWMISNKFMKGDVE